MIAWLRDSLRAIALMAIVAVCPALAQPKADVKGDCNALAQGQDGFALTLCLNFPIEAHAAQLRQREQDIRKEEAERRVELAQALADARQRTDEQSDLIKAKKTEIATLERQRGEVEARLSSLETSYKARIADLEKRYQELLALGGDADPRILATALAALERGDSSEADKLFAQIVKADRTRAERASRAMFERGKIADARIDWRAAATHFRAAADRAPENGEYQRMAAQALIRIGDPRLAESYALKAVRLAEARGEEALLPLASALNGQASALEDIARYVDAEPLYRRSLALHEKALGPEHPDVATTLNNLAGLLQSQGKYANAEPLYRRSLAIKEKALGPEHPSVAPTLNNLAGLLRRQGSFADAEPLYRRALALHEKALGPEHPDVAATLNNLAGLLRRQGSFADAEPLYRRSLAIKEKALGPEHPSVATTLNNLAGLLESQGRFADADPLYRRSLTLREKALGPEHPDVATTLNNLAGLLTSQGRFADAEPLYRRALAILRAAFPNGHPNIATVETNYAAMPRKRDAPSANP